MHVIAAVLGRDYQVIRQQRMSFIAAVRLRWQRAALLFTCALLLAYVAAVWNPSTYNFLLGFQARGLTWVPLTLLRDAAEEGAVCLDGSPPGYYLKRGWGSGESNWLIFLEGGGWCGSEEECAARAGTRLGSSRSWPRSTPLQGMLSNDSEVNPDFHNWNSAYVKYCDGASFAGDVDEAVEVEGQKIFFRGQRIFQAVVADLLALGLVGASHALLSGCSAGALAALLHCQQFGSMLSEATRVKCMSDAGFFLDRPDIQGQQLFREFYRGIVRMQNVRLDKDCEGARTPEERWQCFFPEYLVRFITVPLFILNPLYDTWQVGNVFVPLSADPEGSWAACRSFNHPRCSLQQVELLHVYREEMHKALAPVLNSPSGGAFLDSCFIHCQAQWSDRWHNRKGPLLTQVDRDPGDSGQTIAETVGDWYFERREAKLVDCPYPCNPTCPIL